MRAGWVLLSVLACSAPSTAPMPPDKDAGASDAGGSDPDGGTIAEVADGGNDGGEIVPMKSLGIIVVDVQETFVDIAVNRDLAGVIANAQVALELAPAHELPLFITYEDSMSGDHALPAPLREHVPPLAREFVKTKFDATQLPALNQAVQEAARTHWAVLGSETDVCVLQTVLGLRALGHPVLLVRDGVLSSEPNTSPALRRMQQAGVSLIVLAELEAMAADPSLLPDAIEAPVRATRPLQMAVLLDRFTDDALALTADPLRPQKEARLRELLLVSEWFELPVFADAALPLEFAQLYSGELLPVSSLPEHAEIEQLVIAGIDDQLEQTLNALPSHQLFLMEDALLQVDGPQLDPFFEAGLVPTTYKSFYYDMTKSVDDREWPSQRWVDRAAIYFDLTMAPEDLPPMPFTPP